MKMKCMVDGWGEMKNGLDLFSDDFLKDGIGDLLSQEREGL